jgi:hypothetical protein
MLFNKNLNLNYIEMKMISLNKEPAGSSLALAGYGLIICLLFWYVTPQIIQTFNDTAGSIDASIWLLLLFSITSYFVCLLTSSWLFRSLLVWIGLPNIKSMVLQFNELTLWQQFAFYWASFALLLLTAVLSLAAVL